MRTRKPVALLLALVMSLTMGGISALAAEPEDEQPPETTVTDPVNAPSVKVTGLPTAPLKRGDKINYTVEVEPNGNEPEYGWQIVVKDELRGIIDPSQQWGSVYNLIGTTQEISYEYWASQIEREDTFSIKVELYEYDPDAEEDTEMAASSETYYVSTLASEIEFDAEFSTENIVAGKEYPFTVTFRNPEEIDHPSLAFLVKVREELTKAYIATFNVVDCPEGTNVLIDEDTQYKDLWVGQINVPAGGTVQIKGTITFPEVREDVSVVFNAFQLGNTSSGKFSVRSATGGSDTTNPDPGPGTDTNNISLKDNATGITVSGVEKGIELNVASADKDEQASIEEKVKKLVDSFKGIKIFDISLLKDGKEIQPQSPVKVTIPIPQGFSTNLKLYHQNEQGGLDPIDITVKDAAISFEAKSFSPYVIVDLGADKGSTPANPSSGKTSGTTPSKSPKTGDMSSVMLYLVMALAAMGSAGFAMKRKLNR